MKIVKIILVAVALACNINFCQAQTKVKIKDKTFQMFLNKFKTIEPPFIYKKIKHIMGDLTKTEAIKYLQKKTF